jgi:hypothetical protein
MDSKSMLRSTWLLALSVLLYPQKTIACGYAYVSDCATTVDIERDGVTNTYQLSNCPYLTVFNNHSFGTVSSLSISKAT